MSTAREPNPLRPYYIPPSVGHPPEAHHSSTTASNICNKHASNSTSPNSFGSSARNILADMDYSDYISDSPSPTETLKGLAEQAIWKYTSVLLAQPFDVAKTVLQVHVATRAQTTKAKDPFSEDPRKRPTTSKRDFDDSSDSDFSSPSYFTTSAPHSHTPTRRGRRRRTSSSPGIPRVHTPQPPPPPEKSPHTLVLKSSSSVLTTLSTLWTAEGAWGLWKGTNATYIHNVLLTTITSFARSFFSALLGLPDPGISLTSAGGLDLLSSPSPLSSLVVAVSAAGIAGTLLAPLDIARTKMILTPSTHPPRSILATLRSLPSWTLPFSIAPPTILHSALPTFISASTPLFLRSKLGIDPLLTPNMYAIATFTSQVLELAVKLPLETVLRRGQIAVARSTPQGREVATIVDIGAYKGLFGTVTSIIYEEGERPKAVVLGAEKGGKGKKGQGVEALWRGWRVGMWGLVGVWGAATLGGVGGKGGEF